MASGKIAKSLYRLTVVNIPWTIGDLQLKQYFSQFGKIASAKVFFDRNTGLSRSTGIIETTDKETFESILSKENHVLDEKEIYVRKWQ